jgi:hypothetical protein
MIVNHNKYRKFEYENNPSKSDAFILGEVVYNVVTAEIGVIIQCHGNDEYRTDMFGNCAFMNGAHGDVVLATDEQIWFKRNKLLKGM